MQYVEVDGHADLVTHDRDGSGSVSGLRSWAKLGSGLGLGLGLGDLHADLVRDDRDAPCQRNPEVCGVKVGQPKPFDPGVLGKVLELLQPEP